MLKNNGNVAPISNNYVQSLWNPVIRPLKGFLNKKMTDRILVWVVHVLTRWLL